MSLFETYLKHKIESSRITLDEMKDYDAAKFPEKPEYQKHIYRWQQSLINFNTKQELKQELKIIEDEIAERVVKNRNNRGIRVWNDHAIEQLSIFKDKLSAKLKDINTNRGDSILAAKNIPLEYYIDFNRGNVTNCLWHDDKNASLHYYRKTNTAYCFGCQKKVDTIEAVMKIHNKSFIKAIEFLNGK